MSSPYRPGNNYTIDADLAAISALTGAGLLARTAENTWALRTLQAPAAGLTITNPAGTAASPSFAFVNDLGALEALASTGIAVRSTIDTWVQRTITGTAAEITLTDGDGVANNPTISIPAAVTFTGKTITGGTYASPTLSGTLVGSGTIGGSTIINTAGAITGAAGTFTAINATGNVTVALASMTNSVKLGQVSDDLTYGAISFNGSMTGAGMQGWMSRGTSDLTLYGKVQTGGEYDLRINGVPKLILNTSTLTLPGTAAATREGLVLNGTTTAAHYMTLSNDGCNLRLGIDNSAGTALIGGGTAYGAVVGTNNNTILHLVQNGDSILRVQGTGIALTGFYEGIEQTAPAAGATNTGRMFYQDNGAGKTQLMVIFNTGAAQQIAIQP